jgi:hypothetical protein
MNTSCDSCNNYIYDEEFEEYVCEVDMDEDEMGHFLTNSFYQCPYYQFNDEYKVVRKQM